MSPRFLPTVLLLLLHGNLSPAAATPGPGEREPLLRENLELRQRLNSLLATSESFRWGRFERVPLLRSGSVLDCALTPRGSLLLATDGQGLVMFDGTVFEKLTAANSALPDNFVTSVLPLDEGLAVIGTAAGPVYLRDTGIEPIPGLPDSLSTAMVSCLASPGAGDALFIGTQGLGAWRLEKGVWSHWSAQQAGSGLSSNDINDLAWNGQVGELWAATSGGGVCRLSGESRECFPEPLGTGSSDIYSLAVDMDGLTWLGSVESGAGFFDGARWRASPLPVPDGTGVVSIAPLEGGDLFFGSTEGSYIYSRARGSFGRLPVPDELAPYPVSSAIEIDGRLWLSPSGRGVHLYDRRIIRSFDAENSGLPSDIVYHVAVSGNGRVWCSTWNGVGIYDGTGWASIGRRHGLPDNLVTCVLFGPGGEQYFGTHRGAGILRDGEWEVIDRDRGLSSNTVNHLMLDSGGRLWISTEGGGLSVLNGDSLLTLGTEQGLPASQVQATVQAADGAVWAATRRGPAVVRGDFSVEAAGESAAGKSTAIPGAEHFTALALGPDSSLWAATYDNGVWRGDTQGEWTHYTVEQGLGSNRVFCAAADRRGRMCFATDQGLSIFDGTHWMNLTSSDGLPPGAVRWVAAAPDSSLWLAVEERGVARFDPETWPAPETFILTRSGAATACDRAGHTFSLLPSSGPDSSYSGSGAEAKLFLGGTLFGSRAPVALTDTISEPDLAVTLSATVPWWSGTPADFRYSYSLDNGPWSEFRFANSAGLHSLSRGPHELRVRAKGSVLLVDPTPAVYLFFVDVPSIWSDWRLWAAVAGIVLLTAGTIKRRAILWHLRRLAHGSFRPVRPNPFNPSAPATESERFSGRGETLGDLAGSFSDDPGAVTVEAGEKEGLTSFLLRLAETASGRGMKTVYLDLRGRYYPDTGHLVSEILARAGLDEHNGLAGIGSLAGQEAPLALIFDNAEVLGRVLQRDETGAADLQSSLRELVLGESRVSLVFGVHSSRSFRDQAGVLFDMSRFIRLGPLDSEESRAALSAPLRGRVLLRDEALELAARLGGGHPALLQSLGRSLVERLNSERTNLCTLEHLRNTVDDLVREPPVIILDRWEELTRREKLFLAAGLEAAGDDFSRPFTARNVERVLERHSIELIEEELAKTAEGLARRGLLESGDGAAGGFRPPDSLFHRWVAATRGIDRIRDQEDYELGETMRRLADELTHSFRIEELAAGVMEFLGDILHCEWGVLLTTSESDDKIEQEDGGENSITLRASGRTGEVPAGLSTGASLDSGGFERSFGAGEARALDEPLTAGGLSLEAGTLAVGLFVRAKAAGLLVLGPRRDGERYSRKDRMFLETVAEQLAVAVENVRLYQEETEKERMRQELETARRMQLAILPVRRPEFPGLDIFSYLEPATEVGGDYFDYRQLDDSRVIFLIGDVSGHGISAGTLVSMSKSLIFNQLRFDYSVERVMDAMNAMVRGALNERLLMTMCYSIFDLGSRVLSYSLAGHPFPYHYSSAEASIGELEMPAYPLGVSAKATYNVNRREFGPGDVFVFYSDGIVEGVNRRGEQFGFGRFEQAVAGYSDLDAESISKAIIGEFRRFQEGAAQEDDVTLVVVKIQ